MQLAYFQWAWSRASDSSFFWRYCSLSSKSICKLRTVFLGIRFHRCNLYFGNVHFFRKMLCHRFCIGKILQLTLCYCWLCPQLVTGFDLSPTSPGSVARPYFGDCPSQLGLRGCAAHWFLGNTWLHSWRSGGLPRLLPFVPRSIMAIHHIHHGFNLFQSGAVSRFG